MSDAALANEYWDKGLDAEAKPQPDEEPWLPFAEDAADIVTEVLPPLVEVVEGIVAENAKLVIASSAKAFKTWLTMNMGLAIAHGIPFLGRKTTRKRVLYVNLELKPSTFKRRVQAIAKALGIAVGRSWFIHLSLRGRMAGVSVADLVTRIIRLAQHFKVEVVILDPVFKANTEGEENNTRDQTIFFNQLDRITTEGNATLILNDHSGKGNQSDKDPLDVIRGSSAKGGDVDAAMILRKHDTDACFRVDMVHRELPAVAPFTVGWKFPLMELRPDLNPEDMKKAQGGRKKAYQPEKLLAVIAATTAESPVSISAWAKAAQIPRQTLSEYLHDLRAKRWIETAGEGSQARQFITDAGRQAIRNWKNEA